MRTPFVEHGASEHVISSKVRWQDQHLTCPDDLRAMMWSRLKRVLEGGSNRDATNVAKVVADFDRIDIARQQLQDEKGITIEARPIDADGLAELQAFAARILLGGTDPK